MAHDLPLGSMIALSDGRLVAADARDASNQKLRVAFSGNSDVSDVDTENDIFCKARTAMMASTRSARNCSAGSPASATASS